MSACYAKPLERRVWRSLLPAAVLLTACGFVDPRTYFTVRRGDFERIVERVESCQPTGRVTANGLEFDGNSSDVRCANAEEDIDTLRRELRVNGFRSVGISRPNIDERRSNLTRVNIDDNNTDCTIGVIYESEPDPTGGEHIYSAFADEYERFPLTGPPQHWFCESIGF
jgi:hypothetical protein